jgi:iron-sulfur cluster assembly accessory protein
MSQVLDSPAVTLSDRAAARIAKILAKEPAGSMLRVAVNGGGCSGFQYDFQITTGRNADDLVVEKAGVQVVIDELSMQYLAGSEIDYADELIGASFKITNPNATSSCGCGTSFSV